MVVELMQLAGVFNVGDFVPALAWLDPQGVVGKMKRLHRRYDDMMNGIIRERKAAGEGKDLLSVLLARMREQQPLADGEDSRINETDIKALLLVSLPSFFPLLKWTPDGVGPVGVWSVYSTCTYFLWDTW